MPVRIYTRFFCETVKKYSQCLQVGMGKMNKIVTLPMNGRGKEPWFSLLQQAHSSLTSENIIAVPTDTIYGIAGLAQSERAISQIYAIKARDAAKPIAICVGDVEDVYKWGNVTITSELLNTLLPGPVTVVFERTPDLNPHLNPGTQLVGIRVPDYGFVRDISRHCSQPLALTSANISSAPSTVSVEEFQELWEKLDVIFDGGKLGLTAQARQGSTVVDLSQQGHFRIIRQGSAYRDTLATLLKHGLAELKLDS